ncbi:hypothetical protein PAXRUDRAFT_144531 [Paxillus rubicundulus Ve08.2h10]|uniref:Unplaced genomic scaffold scaffold_343, whole genome shotgun sequence n=1 Tax=Paxillus rubicundulus Ve08.2h10 TaxID=930991 RepID=A0A0D0E725_9AGAM|nr:hypothetical protein PAXRUDRAFT_144531 [Paxillus rubicundulus Ve08.2h10]
MRFAVALFALTGVSSVSSALVARQSLPNCAAPCLTNANFDGCSPDDDSCLCHDQVFIDSTTSCIQSSCTGSDLAEAEAFAQSLCLAVGVTLTAASTIPTPMPYLVSSLSPSSTGAASSNGISMFAGAAAAIALAAVL